MVNHSKLNDAPTGRIDTTITETEVTGVEGWTFTAAAVNYVTDQFPEANVLGAWRTGERGRHGYAVWAVEWEPPEEES